MNESPTPRLLTPEGYMHSKALTLSGMTLSAAEIGWRDGDVWNRFF